MKKQLLFTIYSLLISLTLLDFGIGNHLLKNENDEIIRILSDKSEIDICYKVSDSFEGKYGNLDSKTINKLNYTGNEEKLIDYLKNKSMINSLKYLKTFLVSYSIAISVDIILIFVWIYSWSCVCNPRLCCIGERGCFCHLSMYITLFMFFLLIFNGVVGVIFWDPLKNNLAEAGCSFNKIFDHLKNGFGEDYEKSKEWSGFDEIFKALSDSIDIDTSELKNKYETINECKNTGTDKKLDESCKNLKKGIDIINKIDSSSIQQLETSINLIKDFKMEFLEVEKNYKEDIISKNNILINLGNLYLALFILMILFGALGFFILLSYTQKCKCSQCFLPFYIVFWNFEALFMIFLILMGIFFGLIGSISKNIISISLYSTSSENLDSQNPIIYNKSISNYIDICVNKNPTLSEILNLTKTPINQYNELIKIKENVEGNINDLNNYGNKYDGIKDWLNKLNIIVNKIYLIYNDKINIKDGSLYDIVNCRFIRQDLNIFFDIVANHLIKYLKKLELIFYSSGLYLVISIIFGIIVIKRTYYKSEEHQSHNIPEISENNNNTGIHDSNNTSHSNSQRVIGKPITE